MMSPLELQILLHYHVSSEDYPRANHGSIKESIDVLHRCSLIEPALITELTEPHHPVKPAEWQLTNKGKAHLNQILNLALPREVYLNSVGNEIELT